MRLATLRLQNYRRFKGEHELRIQTKVCALLGPNEAGKSSVLDALAHLGHDGQVPPADISRGVTVEDDSVVIEWEFALDPDDIGAIDDVPEAAAVTHFRVSKTRKGRRTYQCRPPVERDDRDAQAQLRQVIGNNPGLVTAELESKLLQALNNKRASAAQKLKYLAEVRAHLDPHNTATEPLASAVSALLSIYGSPDPSDSVRGRLEPRIPAVLVFSNQDRELPDSIDFADPGQQPPRAWQHLLQAAQLDVAALRKHIGNTPVLRGFEDRANRTLEQAFKQRWSQANVAVSLRVEASALHLHMEDRGDGSTYTKVSERSMGMRQFVGMMSMLANGGLNQPILLIDEAEQHLHYDAQADLLRMLHAQQVVRQVVFTTHSAGCLPNDLGRGVIGVARHDIVCSRFVHNFWHSTEDDVEPSARPLLVALGASTMAFLPLRSAVLVEGVSDMLLLPQLFREAAGVDDLGFQVVPGVAMASLTQLSQVTASSPSTAYVLDDDSGGAAKRKQLRDAGVQERMIRMLPSTTLEGCIDLSRYVLAVNECVSGLQIGTGDFEVGVERTLAVRQWCEKHGRPGPPRKIDVAYALLRQVDHGAKILDVQKKPEIAALYREVHRIVGV